MSRLIRILATTLVMLLLITSTIVAEGDRAALWEGAKSIQLSADQERASYPMLRMVMENSFALTDDETKAAVLAAAMPLLAAVPTEDLDAFAQDYGLPQQIVVEAYYTALSNAIRADIQINPAADANRQHVQNLLLGLLAAHLDDGAGQGGEKAATVSAEDAEQIAAEYNLPKDYVQFLAATAEGRSGYGDSSYGDSVYGDDGNATVNPDDSGYTDNDASEPTKVPESNDSGYTDNNDSDYDEPKPTKKPAATKKPNNDSGYSDNNDSDYDEPKPTKKPAATKKPDNDSGYSDNNGSDYDEPKPTKKPAATKKPDKDSGYSDNNDSGYDEPKPTKKPEATKKPDKDSGYSDNDDGDSDYDD